MGFFTQANNELFQNKDAFLVYLENSFKKGIENKTLPSNIRLLCKELDEQLMQYAGIPSNSIKPHIFESLYDNAWFKRAYGAGVVKPSYLHYNDVADELLTQSLDGLEKTLAFTGGKEEYKELSVLLKDVIARKKSGDTVSEFSYGAEAIMPYTVENLINGLKSVYSSANDATVRQTVGDVLAVSSGYDERLIDLNLPSFLKQVTAGLIPLSNEGANEFIGKIYRECYNAEARLEPNVYYVDKDFLNFVSSRYSKRTGITKNFDTMDEFVKTVRQSSNSISGFLREDIKTAYGDKMFITKDAVTSFALENEIALNGICPQTFADVKKYGLGLDFLNYLKSSETAVGVWDLKYSDRDIFYGKNSDEPRRAVEPAPVRDDEVIRKYNSEILAGALGENAYANKYETFKLINDGKLNIEILGNELENLDVSELIEKFSIDYVQESGKASYSYAVNKAHEFLKYFMDKYEIDVDDIAGLTSNERQNPNPIEKLLYRAAGIVKLAQGDFIALATDKDADKKYESKVLDHIRDFAISVDKIKKDYTDLNYELKNIVTNGYSLNRSPVNSSRINDVNSYLSELGATGKIIKKLDSEIFNLSLLESSKLNGGELIEDVTQKYNKEGYGEVVNYANKKESDEANSLAQIKSLMTNVNFAPEYKAARDIPIIRDSLYQDKKLLEIIRNQLACLHARDDKNFNMNLLCDAYNELVKNDGVNLKISPYELDPNTGKPTGVLKNVNYFKDKAGRIDLDNKELINIEAVFLTRLAQSNVLAREIQFEYPEIIKKIDEVTVNPQEFMDKELADYLGLDENTDILAVKDALLDKQQEIQNSIFYQNDVENELVRNREVKDKILAKTEFLRKKDKALEIARNFFLENKERLDRNFQNETDDLFLGIEIPQGMFFTNDELKELYVSSIKNEQLYGVKDEAIKIREAMSGRIKRLGFDDSGRLVEANDVSSWMNLNRPFYSPVFASLKSKGVDVGSQEGDADSKDSGGKEAKGKGGSNGITDETLNNETQRRLENNPDRDNPEVIEATKNEVKREFEELIELERLREKIKIETQKAISQEVKDKSDEYKQDAINKADKEYNDILSEIAHKYDVKITDVVDSLGGKVIDTSNLDEGTIDEIKNLIKEVGILDHRIEQGEQILVTPDNLADEYYKTALLDNIIEGFDEGRAEIEIDEYRLANKDENDPEYSSLAIQKPFEDKIAANVEKKFNSLELRDDGDRFRSFYSNLDETENYSSAVKEVNSKITQCEDRLSNVDDFLGKTGAISNALKLINADPRLQKALNIYKDMDNLTPAFDFNRMTLSEIKEGLKKANEYSQDPNVSLKNIISELSALSSDSSLESSVRTVNYNKKMFGAKNLEGLRRYVNDTASDPSGLLNKAGTWLRDLYENDNIALRRELAQRTLNNMLQIFDPTDLTPRGKLFKGLQQAKDMLNPFAWFTTFFELVKTGCNVYNIVKYKYDTTFKDTVRQNANLAGILGTQIKKDEAYVKELAKVADKAVANGLLTLDDIDASTPNAYLKEIRNMNKNVFIKTFSLKDASSFSNSENLYNRENIMANITSNIETISRRIATLENESKDLNSLMSKDDINRLLLAYNKTMLVQASFYNALEQNQGISASKLAKLETDVYARFSQNIDDVKNMLSVEKAISQISAPSIIQTQEALYEDRSKGGIATVKEVVAQIQKEFGDEEIPLDLKSGLKVRDILAKVASNDFEIVNSEGKIDYSVLAQMVESYDISTQEIYEAATNRLKSALNTDKYAGRDIKSEMLGDDPVIKEAIKQNKFGAIEQYKAKNEKLVNMIALFAANGLLSSGSLGSSNEIIDTFIKNSGLNKDGAMAKVLRKVAELKYEEEIKRDYERKRKKAEDDLNLYGYVR